MKTSVVICLGVLLFCSGCSSSSSDADADAGVEIRSLSDLVGMAMAEVEEVQFCLAEDAGTESLQQSADRLQKVVQALPGAVSNTELTEAKKDEINRSIEALKQAWEGLASAISSQSSSAEISKANSKIHREIESLSKLSR